MEFFHKPTSFRFMGTRRVWYALSAVLMIVSITSLATRGLNLAIDFTGGATVEAKFPKTADLDAVRARLAAAGIRDAQVQNYGSSRDIAIRLSPAAVAAAAPQAVGTGAARSTQPTPAAGAGAGATGARTDAAATGAGAASSSAGVSGAAGASGAAAASSSSSAAGSARGAAANSGTEASTSSTGAEESAIRARIEPVLRSVDPGVTIQDVSAIGPQVGGELERSAAWALAFTLGGIFIYIAFRFHTWRLSLGAIVAVIHDPVLVLGIFSLDRTSFDLPVVAAVLAVVGYSLNDTVVVFDRIRERFHAARRLPSATVLDQSINQTLSRTIMTKVVTSIVVVALLVLGGPVLRGFSEALLIGIIAGTYSSIYISSAIALDCGLTAEHIFPTVKKTALDHMP
ncbi:MAG TPA: protein translocase subunit SecF [Steroidobacteraceae bacterium]|nr:protein translocase subunit SecF [Steroidobacteraceae bacterium]